MLPFQQSLLKPEHPINLHIFNTFLLFFIGINI
jgi:hypothetical protein